MEGITPTPTQVNPYIKPDKSSGSVTNTGANNDPLNLNSYYKPTVKEAPKNLGKEIGDKSGLKKSSLAITVPGGSEARTGTIEGGVKLGDLNVTYKISTQTGTGTPNNQAEFGLGTSY